jgi:large repetitive protein
VITLTGTGFTSAINGLVTLRAGGPEALLSDVSATSATLTLATALSSSDVSDAATGTYPDKVAVTVSGDTSAAFGLTIDAAPTVTDAALTYATSNTADGVGVGSTATSVVITGTGFQTGATVTKFTNATGVADPDVTVTVTSVASSGDTIDATVAVAAGDLNTSAGYTVTNPDGGTAVVTGIEASAIKIDAAPVITSVSPATAAAGSSTAFTITGTGFSAGSTVSLSSDGTCGPAVFATPTSTSATLTATCTIGAAPTAAVSIVVTNVDGGSASSVVLALSAAKPAFKVTGAHGTAIAGKTSTLTISGTGFYGQPKITSTAKGTKVGVSKDTGKVLTIHVTTKKGVAGEHTFTIKLADGKSAKANYLIKK